MCNRIRAFPPLTVVSATAPLKRAGGRWCGGGQWGLYPPLTRLIGAGGRAGTGGGGAAGGAGPGWCSHSGTALYISLRIIDTKYTGLRQTDVTAHGLGGAAEFLRKMGAGLCSGLCWRSGGGIFAPPACCFVLFCHEASRRSCYVHTSIY
jgi:hypothetical protein